MLGCTRLQNFRPLGPLFLVEVEFVCGWWVVVWTAIIVSNPTSGWGYVEFWLGWGFDNKKYGCPPLPTKDHTESILETKEKISVRSSKSAPLYVSWKWVLRIIPHCGQHNSIRQILHLCSTQHSFLLFVILLAEGSMKYLNKIMDEKCNIYRAPPLHHTLRCTHNI